MILSLKSAVLVSNIFSLFFITVQGRQLNLCSKLCGSSWRASQNKPDNGVFYSFLWPGPLFSCSQYFIWMQSQCCNLHAGNNTLTTPTLTVERYVACDTCVTHSHSCTDCIIFISGCVDTRGLQCVRGHKSLAKWQVMYYITTVLFELFCRLCCVSKKTVSE